MKIWKDLKIFVFFTQQIFIFFTQQIFIFFIFFTQQILIFFILPSIPDVRKRWLRGSQHDGGARGSVDGRLYFGDGALEAKSRHGLEVACLAQYLAVQNIAAKTADG